MDPITSLKKLLVESNNFSGTPVGRNCIESVIVLLETLKSKCSSGQLTFINNVATKACDYYDRACSKKITHNRSIKVYNDEVITRVKEIQKSLERL